MSLKIRLYLSKMATRSQDYQEAIRLLWDNINSHKVNLSLLLNDQFSGKDFSNKKVLKEVKYFLVSVLMLVLNYFYAGEITCAFESLRMLEWLNEAFFENSSNFCKSILKFSTVFRA